MAFFEDIKTLQELKKAFQKLCAKYHPDRGGSTEMMQQINAEYSLVMKKIISSNDAFNYKDTKEKDSRGFYGFWESREEHEEVEAKIREILEKIAHLEGLEIEIIGVWVWVSGNTRTYKDLLKAEKFIWQKAKEKWVFMGKKSNGRGTMSMDEMREKYGSEKVEIKPLKTIKC
jgi:hypothetical protein